MISHNNKRQLARQRSNHWIDNLFEDSFFGPYYRFDRVIPEFNPTTDVSETKTEVKIICNVPGMTKESLKIDIDDEHRAMTVSGHVQKEKKEDNERYHCVERLHGSFSRTVYLPQNADLDNIKASLENGVLRVSVPKLVEESKKKTRSVDIQ